MAMVGPRVVHVGSTVSLIGGRSYGGGKVDTMHSPFSFDFPDLLQWKRERIVWIGLDKNEKNQKCFFNSVGKDVVKLILTFLRFQLNQKTVQIHPLRRHQSA